MTRSTAKSRHTHALRNVRNLRFAADVETDPTTRAELERQWNEARTALAFANAELRRAVDAEASL